mgnify:CR=1 FL=1
MCKAQIDPEPFSILKSQFQILVFAASESLHSRVLKLWKSNSQWIHTPFLSCDKHTVMRDFTLLEMGYFWTVYRLIQVLYKHSSTKVCNIIEMVLNWASGIITTRVWPLYPQINIEQWYWVQGTGMCCTYHYDINIFICLMDILHNTCKILH